MKTVCLALALTVLIPASDAQAARRSASEAGLRIAGHRGYSGATAQCFAHAFAQYAHPGPRGGWRVARSRKTLALFHADLHQNCHVSA